ncbi:Uu.00g109090.m01.CDS01 [Anthostomella pinea]|uniref:Uu.00g109090.m01.CDS01 n=1 Tax=Anthostomella pinea TaxID=933095 RepID=A0AAI8V9I0_9PEZI|nr:Uu.00g109090.m01.CDS01 [Anthostomella pinea]
MPFTAVAVRALEAATSRATFDRQSALERLPNELKLRILGQHVECGNIFYTVAIQPVDHLQTYARVRISDLEKFSINKGLAKLHSLELQGAVDAARHEISNWKRRTNNCRDRAWRAINDTLWLTRSDGCNELYSMDVTPILAKFTSNDSGPQDAWYRMLCQIKLGPVPPFVEEQLGGFFACDNCMMPWAFIFWDRKRLELHARGCFPTMPQVHDVASSYWMQHYDSAGTNAERNLGNCLRDKTCL